MTTTSVRFSDSDMVNARISRRQLLRGEIRGEQAPIRPPWAAPEAEFTATCDRCGDCLDACGERIIRAGAGGYPLVDFALGGCTFCAECLSACDALALRGNPVRDAPWQLIARIGDGCVAFRGVICRTCFDACDEGAIHFRLQVGRAAQPTLISDNCTGCGYCVAACPVQAVGVRMPAMPQTTMAEVAGT